MFGFNENYQIINGSPYHIARIQRSLITALSILLDCNHTQKVMCLHWLNRVDFSYLFTTLLFIFPSYILQYTKEIKQKLEDLKDDMTRKGYITDGPPIKVNSDLLFSAKLASNIEHKFFFFLSFLPISI
jgi:hypothetical protein